MSKLVTKTLGELGKRLPVGQEIGRDKVCRTLEFNDFMLEHDVWITNLCSKETMGIGPLIRNVVATCIKQIGTHKFEKVWPSESEWDAEWANRCAVVDEMVAADVMYAYFYLRNLALGSEVDHVKVICNGTNHTGDREVKATLDMKSLDVKCLMSDKLEDRRVLYELKKPIVLQGKKVTHFALQPVKWGVASDAMGDIGSNKLNYIASSIYGFNKIPESSEEYDGVFPEEVGRILTKREADKLFNTTVELAGGPQLGIELECPVCGFHIEYPFEWWSYTDFFGGSSL